MKARGVKYYGVGFLSEGPYKTWENGSATKHRQAWKNMLGRCYGKKKLAWYEDATVVEAWHDFQIFSAWYCSQPAFNQAGMHLDKDLLVKGNKLYSPETCCLLPAEINHALIKRKNVRGATPIGTYHDKRSGLYQSSLSVRGRHVRLGYFRSADEAFAEYKDFKELLLKMLAEKYSDQLCAAAFEALMTYEVEIGD